MTSSRLPMVSLLGFLAVVFVAAVTQTSRLQSDEPRVNADAQPRSATGPEYTDDGELKRPTDFQSWIFVGSNLGLEYDEKAAKEKPPAKDPSKPAKAANFHNVYINPEAYAHYVKTGTFPEKTVLILDIFKAEERESGNIVSEGLVPGPQSGLAVAVKNSARLDGAKTNWAYYDFGLESKTAKAFPDKACYDCHLNHADDDNVWVQFYPTLRTHRAARAKK